MISEMWTESPVFSPSSEPDTLPLKDVQNFVLPTGYQYGKLSADNIHMKILVPSVAAGAIIGKGGETIAQVQKEAGARVKMSKANDFYPGTTERVCLIMGAVEAVRHVHSFIMEKIREKPEGSPKSLDSSGGESGGGGGKGSYERHKQVDEADSFQVKILVPNSTAGMIIGKGGNYIKQIKEESGAYVQISQKSKETNLPERCVTVAGDTESNKLAVDMILQKIVEDPQSGSCPNISYADYTGPVASANPTGSPFANTAHLNQSRPGMEINTGFGGNFAGPGGLGSFSGFSQSNGNYGGMGGGPGGVNTMPGNMGGSAVDNLKATLRNSGYSDQATDEISTAMNTLASYGFLGMGMGLSGGGASQNMSAPAMSPSTAAAVAAGMGGSSPQAMNTGHNLNSPMGPTSLMSSTATTPTSNVNNAFLNTSNPPAAGSLGAGAGSLFGPVGSTSTAIGSTGGSTGPASSLFSNSSPSLSNERYAGSPMLNDSFGSNYATSQYAGSSGMGGERSPSMNQNSFGLGTAMSGAGGYSPTADDKAGLASKRDMEVQENIVGAILGPGGKGIVELQHLTGTNIQISKKGVYVPGTRNRIVTITGMSTSIQQAQYLIQQRIQQEEVKRARQGAAR